MNPIVSPVHSRPSVSSANVLTGRPSGASQRTSVGPLVAAIIAAWGLAVAVLSAAGLFSQVPLPWFPALVATLTALPTASYFAIPAVRVAFDGFGQRRVLLLHAWRILAAAAFFWFGAQGLLPAVFVRHAAWGDLLAGVLGVMVALAWPRRAGFLTFHVLGFADFLLAVGTGFVLTLAGDPAMAPIAAFPLALIPLFGVALSGASHIASLAQLAARRERP
jgi:hypothetical protein